MWSPVLELYQNEKIYHADSLSPINASKVIVPILMNDKMAANKDIKPNYAAISQKIHSVNLGKLALLHMEKRIFVDNIDHKT